MKNPREELLAMLETLGHNWRVMGRTDRYEIVNAHDVHGYYRFDADASKILHVQAYPGMSTPQAGRFFARMMDYRGMLQERLGGVSPGNEHRAVITPFPNFHAGVEVQNYSLEKLEELLEENLAEEGI
ncbi:hypothetical protein KA107_02595 [Candidatus Pacearchaeota archaeon]|nr:hypothetical protein [Candidatus Pacearchaeota archaeon]